MIRNKVLRSKKSLASAFVVEIFLQCRRGPNVNKLALWLILGRGQPAGLEFQ